MAWKWHQINSYKASLGREAYYGIIQLNGEDFYGSIKFHKTDDLPDCTVSTSFFPRFYGHMDFQQFSGVIDILRNESPVRIGWDERNPNRFHLMTMAEEVGEGDGMLNDGA